MLVVGRSISGGGGGKDQPTEKHLFAMDVSKVTRSPVWFLTSGPSSSCTDASLSFGAPGAGDHAAALQLHQQRAAAEGGGPPPLRPGADGGPARPPEKQRDEE